MFFRKKEILNSVFDVEKYYDDWTERYIEFGGELIQAYRTSDDSELLEYYLESAKIKAGQVILDSGCGICGVSSYFASKLNVCIDAITVSQVQVDLSKSNLKQRSLKGSVKVIKGDYHNLSEYFIKNRFDRILFIESLGHTIDVNRVIKESYTVLKSGGSIYIKDFFKKKFINNFSNKRYYTVVNNINKIYKYNTLDLEKTIASLRCAGFDIEFIKKPDFKDDISVRLAFETKNNINIFGQDTSFVPTEWLEIKCIKT